MRVRSVRAVSADRAEACWRLYEDAFSGLRTVAVQRHLMYRGEFDELMADARVTKHLAIDEGGALAGLATSATDLDAVPLISPPYFEARWPAQYRERRIFYVSFVAVHPVHHGGAAFPALVAEIGNAAAGVAGVIVVDFCRMNSTGRRNIPKVASLLLRRSTSPGVRMTVLDEQVYYAYEFPERSGERLRNPAARVPPSVAGQAQAVVSREAGSGRP